MRIQELLRKALEDCKETTEDSIAAINRDFPYTDQHPHGKNDQSLVSCGQCGDYNELDHIYKHKLEPYIKKGKITHSQAIAALRKACESLPSPRQRTDFYAFLSRQLDVKIA